MCLLSEDASKQRNEHAGRRAVSERQEETWHGKQASRLANRKNSEKKENFLNFINFFYFINYIFLRTLYKIYIFYLFSCSILFPSI